MAQLLLFTSPDIDLVDTALAFAAQTEHLSIAEVLLQAGADINKRDHYHKTPLAHAALHGRVEMTNFLLK